jgi:hypothetical protein
MNALDRLARDLPRRASVMVVDPSPERRRRLARRLRRRGVVTLEVPAPLDAVIALERDAAPVSAVVLGPTLTQTGPPELATFVAESHPAVRVLAV